MLETLKKTIYAGIGAAVFSKDAVESALCDLVKKGKLTTDEAKEFIEKAAARGEETISQTKCDISSKASELAQKWPFVKIEQMVALEARVAALEAKAAECVGDCCSPEAPGEETPQEDVPAQ